mmetsp:Transcript_30211/g.54839  ORF Transcript_30211/g.54839 Transcript_30211/m.54839 type:complete len:217 (+) Transcript_30211:104-754(+)|eukprot:CAMPEP_0197624438 /NCGR_PEP_ID=MMETSP1338-20131121/4074_1 /TAXON_ID=43686 ORGANISM="Pelagodinium beii, Strain RCC1491" /NCGR_SAMPLE_ID=MMETSP1338 /ASSEMBLY_ACC=CAM_ASM_000754 /LENGTH=216 /DNA_ID=CAMNT_0043194575 /DNA_START=104 /DNA_END=754 /DNA_ORIENTATION=+
MGVTVSAEDPLRHFDSSSSSKQDSLRKLFSPSDGESSPMAVYYEDMDKAYLERYLYAPMDDGRWQIPPGPKGSGPRLTIWVNGHREIDHHTFYSVQCSLILCGSLLVEWEAPRRLLQIRECLHDPLKKNLGLQNYYRQFSKAPFARRGGLWGTTARLKAWFAALTQALNKGAFSPGEVAFVLQFLDTPAPEQSPDQVVRSLWLRKNINVADILDAD